ncbi:hypothetical protein D3C78_1646630 [compost metagenome]
MLELNKIATFSLSKEKIDSLGSLTTAISIPNRLSRSANAFTFSGSSIRFVTFAISLAILINIWFGVLFFSENCIKRKKEIIKLTKTIPMNVTTIRRRRLFLTI